MFSQPGKTLANRYKKPDHFTKRAKQEGYAARSVYKLEEIQRRFRPFKKGMRVVDLGCYPGSWSRYILQKIGRQGVLVGVDFTAPELDQGVWLERSIYDVSGEELCAALGGKCHVLVSDMAPRTTGNRLGDHVEQIALASRAWSIAQEILEPGGAFVVKIFDGEDANSFCLEVKKQCTQVKRLKPEATRRQSREFFLIGMGFKPVQ
jgi:23S rRNA (uridine2552-2'-O)-methyltransferase